MVRIDPHTAASAIQLFSVERRTACLLGFAALLPAGFELAKGLGGGAAWHLMLGLGWTASAWYGLFISRLTAADLILRVRRRAGLCTDCGFDLRASEGRCPECGSARV